MSTTAFNYVTAEKSELYRAIMRAFAQAKAHFVVHLRPEDIAERTGFGAAAAGDIRAALDQLVAWGNLVARPDHARVTTVEDFYRVRFLYQLSREGEAAEAALAMFDELLGRRAALQSVALHDIRDALAALARLAAAEEFDTGRVHALLRELAGVFENLAENAQAFMAGLGRTLDLRSVERDAFLVYKEQIKGYLERFLGDLVVLSADVGQLIRELDPRIDSLLRVAAVREAEDAAPAPEPDGPASSQGPLVAAREHAIEHWRSHWQGLRAWFVGTADHPSQASLLQSAARRAISQLLEAVVRLNERRLGRSDRSADFRTLARWFMECEDDGQAHRLWRAAFGLAPARHLGIDAATLERRAREPVSPHESWWSAPPLMVSPRLRATGSYARRGPGEHVRSRAAERARLARELARESEDARAARQRLATGVETTLSAIGGLDENAFRYLLRLLGDALASSTGTDAPIATTSADGAVTIEMVPLAPESRARIDTPIGVFVGRDYRVRISDREAVS